MDKMEKAHEFGAGVLNVTTAAIRDNDGDLLTSQLDRLNDDQLRLVVIAASVHLCAAVDTLEELGRRLGEAGGEPPEDYRPGMYL